MARVFITGSADGLGRATAQTLLDDGHEVVVHARDIERLEAVRDLVDQADFRNRAVRRSGSAASRASRAVTR